MNEEKIEALAKEVFSKENVEIISLLSGFFKNSEKVYMWLHVKNPHFGETSAIRLMLIGRSHKVLAFVKNAIEENWP